MVLRKVLASVLGVSQPDPSWFGNPANPTNLAGSGWTNKNWLISRFHFSFAEYSNPRNLNFGVLRVMNDDLVQPKRGFGAHPHRDVEICTYIVEGHLTHKDSTGTEETLQRGAIQFMTAGSGVTHSEHNLHPSQPLRFIQIWINTRQRGLKPMYGSASEPMESRENKWAHIVSDVKNTAVQTAIKINQDANIFVSEFSRQVSFPLRAGRQAYVLCIEGSVTLTCQSLPDSDATCSDSVASKGQKQVDLTRHDAAELFGPCLLLSTPTDTAHLLIVEMAFTGPGRTDILFA